MTNCNYTIMSNTQLLEQINSFGKKSRYIGRFLQFHYVDLYNEVVKRTSFLDSTYDNKIQFSIRLFCIEHEITSVPKCENPKCDNFVNWRSYGFNHHCCPRCSTEDPKVRMKHNETNILLHGDKNFNNIDKAKQTKKELYGDENYNNREKYEQTCLDKYGDSNIFRLDWVKQKICNTMMQNHGVPWAMMSKEVREKSIHTCNERYGCDYITQYDGFKQVAIQTWQNNYGVDNPSKSEEIKKKINNSMIEHFGVPWAMMSELVRNKAKDTCNEMYGVDNVMQLKEVRDKQYESILKNHDGISPFVSKSEMELDEYIKTIYPGDVQFNVRSILQSRKELDIWIPERRIAIEFNGDYWHMNPKLYSESDYNSTINMTAKQKWEYDELKINECQQMRIELIVVWEYDWVHNKEQVKESLQKLINGV